MNHLNINKTGYTVGILTAVFFIICIFWGVLLTDPVLKELHYNILRLSFPGFAFTAAGVITGLIESFVYGWFFGALLAWLCKKMCVVEQKK